MMEVITCEYCGNSSLPFGNVSVDLTLRKNAWCEHCYRSNDEQQSKMFCTIGCLVEYMKEVMDGKRSLEWIEPHYVKVGKTEAEDE